MRRCVTTGPGPAPVDNADQQDRIDPLRRWQLCAPYQMQAGAQHFGCERAIHITERAFAERTNEPEDEALTSAEFCAAIREAVRN